MAAAMRKLGISAAFLACCLACLGLSACQVFTAGETVSEPNPAEVRRAAAGEAKPAAPNDAVHAGIGKAKEAAPAPAEAAPSAPAETATASHILIRYAGAMRSGPEVTRSKEDAKKLADSVDKKAKAKGADFAALANEFTEDPSGKSTGGKLGTFPRGRMVPEFDKPVFALPPGGVSDVVETAYGFHIIKREN
jgi:parvulin-like peptidyl-prolyl isomerase